MTYDPAQPGTDRTGWFSRTGRYCVTNEAGDITAILDPVQVAGWRRQEETDG